MTYTSYHSRDRRVWTPSGETDCRESAVRAAKDRSAAYRRYETVKDNNEEELIAVYHCGNLIDEDASAQD